MAKKTEGLFLGSLAQFLSGATALLIEHEPIVPVTRVITPDESFTDMLPYHSFILYDMYDKVPLFVWNLTVAFIAVSVVRLLRYKKRGLQCLVSAAVSAPAFGAALMLSAGGDSAPMCLVTVALLTGFFLSVIGWIPDRPRKAG